MRVVHGLRTPTCLACIEPMRDVFGDRAPRVGFSNSSSQDADRVLGLLPLAVRLVPIGLPLGVGKVRDQLERWKVSVCTSHPRGSLGRVSPTL